MFLVFFFVLDLNRTSSVLPKFKDILFALSDSAIDFRLWLIFLFMSFKELLVYSMFVSSQNGEFLRNKLRHRSLR